MNTKHKPQTGCHRTAENT